LSVYKRENTELYSYDFRLDGKRYSGFTGTSDLDEARRFEQAAKDDVLSLSRFCRMVLRKATRRLPSKARLASGYIYVLRSGYFIKIGYSNDPAERMKAITTSSPNECDLLFCLAGSFKLEKQLHAEFAACHYQREWFFLCGKLKRFIAEFEEMQAARQKVPPEMPQVA
jgi:hypothetical protein